LPEAHCQRSYEAKGQVSQLKPLLMKRIKHIQSNQ
jgi:hypothetical protein